MPVGGSPSRALARRRSRACPRCTPISFPFHGRLSFANRSVQGAKATQAASPSARHSPPRCSRVRRHCSAAARCSCARHPRPTAASCSLLSPPPLAPASHLSLPSLPRQSPQSRHPANPLAHPRRRCRVPVIPGHARCSTARRHRRDPASQPDAATPIGTNYGCLADSRLEWFLPVN